MTVNGNGAGPHALDWLRERHAELARDRTLDFVVPGYAGRLVLRCGPAPWSALARVQSLTTVGDDPDGTALLNINCDVIIGACRSVLVRMDDELVSIDQDNPEPVGIDGRLAGLLDAGTTTARETLRWLFPSDVGIGVCAGELLAWTQNADEQVSTEFVSG